MNHDYAHCADYDSKCPNGCFRGELVRDLRDNPRMIGIPVSWMHFKGTDECKLKRTKYMTDYISRGATMALAKNIIVHTKDGYDYCYCCIDPQDITELPATDVVEVVRCRKCKWWKNNDCKNDTHGYVPFDENDFCSQGKRKDGDWDG